MEILRRAYRGLLWVSTTEARQGTKQGNNGGGREREFVGASRWERPDGGIFGEGFARGRRGVIPEEIN